MTGGAFSFRQVAMSEHALRPLIEAADRYHNLTQVLRIAVSGTFVPAMAGEALKNRLARAVDAPSFSVVERDLMETKAMVNAAFAELIERAAG